MQAHTLLLLLQALVEWCLPDLLLLLTSWLLNALLMPDVWLPDLKRALDRPHYLQHCPLRLARPPHGL
jgi:hypothetical protein